MPDEEEEGQVAEEGVVHTKKSFKPRGTGPAMDDPEADRFDPILLHHEQNGGRGGGGGGGRLASRLGPAPGAGEKGAEKGAEGGEGEAGKGEEEEEGRREVPKVGGGWG